MKIDRRGPAEGRKEFQWRVDREAGFETSRLIYDAAGRLVAVDYDLPKREPAVNPPQPPRS